MTTPCHRACPLHKPEPRLFPSPAGGQKWPQLAPVGMAERLRPGGHRTPLCSARHVEDRTEGGKEGVLSCPVHPGKRAGQHWGLLLAPARKGDAPVWPLGQQTRPTYKEWPGVLARLSSRGPGSHPTVDSVPPLRADRQTDSAAPCSPSRAL